MDGRYEMLVTPNQVYFVTASKEGWAALPQTGFAALPGQLLEDKDFVLRNPTRVHGVLMEAGTSKPIPAKNIYVYQYGQDLHSMAGIELPNPEDSRIWVQPLVVQSTTTDAVGRFEILLGDGEFDIRPWQQEKAEKLSIQGEAVVEMNVITEIAREIELSGTAIDANSEKPLAGVRVEGVTRSFRGNEWHAVTDDTGKFRVRCSPEATVVCACSSDKSLAAIAELAANATAIALERMPVGSASPMTREFTG